MCAPPSYETELSLTVLIPKPQLLQVKSYRKYGAGKRCYKSQWVTAMRDFRLPLKCKLNLRPFWEFYAER